MDTTSPPASPLTEPPTNASDLIAALGCDPNEGVQVALFPADVSAIRLADEPFAYEPGVMAFGVLGDLGPWGERLLDMVTEPPSNLKWWKVVDLAREKGLNLVPIRWAGAIQDIPERYFTPGTYLGLRFYNAGPWFWPLEKPLLSEAEVFPEEAK